MKPEIRHYKDGVSYNAISWYPSGQIESLTHYKHHKPNGAHKLWHENGIVKTECMYKDGRLDGALVKRYSNGRIRASYDYSDGRLFGITREWNDRGEIVYEKIHCYLPSYSEKEYLNEDEYILHLLRNNSLTVKDILNVEDADVRHAALKEVGYEKFYSELPKITIDEDNEFKLVTIDWHKEEEAICLVRVRCHSTGTFYALRVPPYVETAKQAVAWTFHMKKNEYTPLEES